MHIIIGFLGSVITILWLLHRLAEMGIDLGGLNPWLWRRRRKWRTEFEANPIFSIDSPMEMTALLVTATAKADGDMTVEEKSEILGIFESEFHLSKRDAAGLLISSTHLLGKGEEVRNSLSKVLKPSIDNFTTDQTQSAIELMKRIASVGGSESETQLELLRAAEENLAAKIAPSGNWS